MSIDTGRAPGYSARGLHFNWAHFEELLELNESCSGEAGKHIRAALEHEWATLPSGIICSCRTDQPIPDTFGGGEARPSARTPNLALADMQRAYGALPMASLSRTELYLMAKPTHAWAIRHPKGQACGHGWSGDNELTHEAGHLVRHTETQIAELPMPEFQARHRRRIALESFLQPSRVQDSWPDPGMGMYAYMADYLDKGEAEFLADGDWQGDLVRHTHHRLPDCPTLVTAAPALDIDTHELGDALDRLEA